MLRGRASVRVQKSVRLRKQNGAHAALTAFRTAARAPHMHTPASLAAQIVRNNAKHYVAKFSFETLEVGDVDVFRWAAPPAHFMRGTGGRVCGRAWPQGTTGQALRCELHPHTSAALLGSAGPLVPVGTWPEPYPTQPYATVPNRMHAVWNLYKYVWGVCIQSGPRQGRACRTRGPCMRVHVCVCAQKGPRCSAWPALTVPGCAWPSFQ